LLAEKKALKRFLIVYVISTMFLVLVGEYFYYKNSYNRIIQNEVTLLKVELRDFLENHRRIFFVSIPSNIKLAIFRNKELINSNFKPKKVYFNKDYWIVGDEIYYREGFVRGWWRVDFVVKKKIDKTLLINLYKELLIFNIFLFLFLILFSIFLGKLFLKPMKDVIENLENFIRDITHEMNTPISVILTNIELLKENYNQKYIQRIESASFRLNKIFEDLKYLNFKREEKKKNINLKKFIENRLNLFGHFIDKKSLKLSLDLEEVDILIDEEDLTRLIDNLLSNAFKYAPFNSTVEIILNKDNFCILNAGYIKNIQNITSKFVRENENEGGFGLGLFIVKDISKKYGFKFKIENFDKKVKVCLGLV